VAPVSSHQIRTAAGIVKLKRSGKTPQNAAQPRLVAICVFRRKPIAPAVAQSPRANMSIELRKTEHCTHRLQTAR
jgi:hypothetical protein